MVHESVIIGLISKTLYKGLENEQDIKNLLKLYKMQPSKTPLPNYHGIKTKEDLVSLLKIYQTLPQGMKPPINGLNKAEDVKNLLKLYDDELPSKDDYAKILLDMETIAKLTIHNESIAQDPMKNLSNLLDLLVKKNFSPEIKNKIFAALDKLKIEDPVKIIATLTPEILNIEIVRYFLLLM